MADSGAGGSASSDDLQARAARTESISHETGWGRLVRKCKEEPIVPIGMTATVAVLGRGMWAMYSGNQVISQRMMRYRVLAQGVTLLAVTYGMVLHAQSPKDPSRNRRPTVDKRFFLDHASELAVDARVRSANPAQMSGGVRK